MSVLNDCSDRARLVFQRGLKPLAGRDGELLGLRRELWKSVRDQVGEVVVAGRKRLLQFDEIDRACNELCCFGLIAWDGLAEVVEIRLCESH